VNAAGRSLARLNSYNRRVGTSIGAEEVPGPEMAAAIAAAIRSLARPCPYEVHPVPCLKCALARQADQFAELAERYGGLR